MQSPKSSPPHRLLPPRPYSVCCYPTLQRFPARGAESPLLTDDYYCYYYLTLQCFPARGAESPLLTENYYCCYHLD